VPQKPVLQVPINKRRARTRGSNRPEENSWIAILVSLRATSWLVQTSRLSRVSSMVEARIAASIADHAAGGKEAVERSRHVFFAIPGDTTNLPVGHGPCDHATVEIGLRAFDLEHTAQVVE